MKRGDQHQDSPPDEGEAGGTSRSRPEPQDNNGVPDEDPVLLEAALQGDIEAFASLFERYRPALYTICLRRLNGTSSAEDAEDAVQEIFIRAFTSLPNFDPHRPLWPWLVTIAFRTCIDLQRRRSPTHNSGDIETTVDADKSRGASEGHGGSALEAVLASEKRAELWQSLKNLPKRQRRVFLLYAVDDWSCAEIAEAEGISVGAVYLLLFRARRKMRSLRESEPLPAIVLPLGWVRWKFQRFEERIRPWISVHIEGSSSACVQLVCLGALAMVVGATSSPAEPSAVTETISDETAVLATQSRALQTASLHTALPGIAAPAEAPVEPQQPAAGPASSLVDDVINPNQNVTPENTGFTSIATSPNYENDHTILATGWSRPGERPGVREEGVVEAGGGYVLFVSNDGGASWKPRPSLFLSGYTVALPPNYPQDRRVFAVGDLGLQQSDDVGEIFTTVSPISSPILGGGFHYSLAISPLFGKGDSKILMDGKTVWEYDADTKITKPRTIFISSSQENIYRDVTRSTYENVLFSPTYELDSTFFASDSHWNANVIYHCIRSICDVRPSPVVGSLTLNLSPRFNQDGLAYAFSKTKFLVSQDGVRTFRDIQFPFHYSGEGIHDMAILWNPSSEPAIFVSVYGTQPGIYRSFDGGRSWSRASINLPWFRGTPLIVTPTGRLLVAATGGGIACSVDFGVTWARRCTPEL